MLDMNISQFLKSLGLEHLRDIFEREQVIMAFSSKHFLRWTCNPLVIRLTKIKLLKVSICCGVLFFSDHTGCAG